MMAGEFDLVILGGMVVDGTGFPRFRADVGVRGGRVVAVGPLAAARARRSLDATGCIVAPGHVDTHTHYDAQVFWDPTCSNAGENGVTTVVAGNCGFGFAPCRPADRDRYMRMMETTEQVPHGQMKVGLPWSWETFPQFVEALRRTPKAVNLMMFLPLNALMFYVMGEEAKRRRPGVEELARMKVLLGEAMDAGACGLSMSYMGEVNNHVDVDGSPMPTDVMYPQDAYALVAALRGRGEGIIQVISQIGPVGDRSISEGLAKASGRPVLHNVFSVSEYTPDLHRRSMDWLSGMIEAGHDMYAATVVTRAWNETELFESPGCSLDALDVYRELTFCPTAEAKRAKLEDADFRARFNAAYDPVMFEATAGALGDYTVIGAGEPPGLLAACIGRRLGDIAAERGVSDVDAFIDLALESNLRIEFRTPGIAIDPVKVAELLSHPNVLAGASDGGAHTKNFSGGQWTTDLLIWLTREHGFYSLEQMHYRLAYQPARVMGLKDRGALLEGMAADVLVYRPDELYVSTERYETPRDQPGGDFRRRARAGGYRWIVVNGEVTFEADAPTGATPGLYLAPTGSVTQPGRIAA
jgi:N-acyl-D-aspartate/D-glutamate deacylase